MFIMEKAKKDKIEKVAEENPVSDKTDNSNSINVVKESKRKQRLQKSTKSKKRSRKYLSVASGFDKMRKYSLEEAVELVKKTSYSKFDGTISLDINLSKSKADESIRGTLKLPYGVEKKEKIAVANDDLIEEVKKGKIDFDILLATPEMMPKLAQIAKILGPKGLMPNPKDGTVVDDPDKAQKQMSEMARYRADAQRNLHITVGKVSWDAKKIAENVKAVLKALTKYKKNTVTLSATMGIGVKIDI